MGSDAKQTGLLSNFAMFVAGLDGLFQRSGGPLGALHLVLGLWGLFSYLGGVGAIMVALLRGTRGFCVWIEFYDFLQVFSAILEV